MNVFHRTSIVAAVSLAAASFASAQAETAWQNLFNGKNIDNWGYVAGNWKVDSGMIVGKSKSTYNNFCHTKRKYSDFVLAIRGRLWETSTEYINSGVQYRSVFIDSSKHSLKGYQMDIGDGYNGSMYPEGGYPAGASGVSPSAACRTEAQAKQNQWCQYVITANGNKIRHEMNGILCAEYTATEKEGYLGMQLHFTTIVMEVDYKDIFIRPLNNSFEIPAADLVYLNADYTLKAGTGTKNAVARNATIAFPPVLDGSRLTIPAFWRGNGEVKVSVLDASGRTEFSRSIIAGDELPLVVGLPNFGAGNHLLRIGSGGSAAAYTGVIRSGN
jgi:hypothetical protein